LENVSTPKYRFTTAKQSFTKPTYDENPAACTYGRFTFLAAVAICFLVTRVIEVPTPFHIFLIAVFLCYSNSFFNPLVCALRIPEFRQALVLWYFRRQEAMDIQRNERRVNMAAGLTPTYS